MLRLKHLYELKLYPRLNRNSKATWRRTVTDSWQAEEPASDVDISDLDETKAIFAVIPTSKPTPVVPKYEWAFIKQVKVIKKRLEYADSKQERLKEGSSYYRVAACL